MNSVTLIFACTSIFAICVFSQSPPVLIFLNPRLPVRMLQATIAPFRALNSAMSRREFLLSRI
jgi:hypothetical protein